MKSSGEIGFHPTGIESLAGLKLDLMGHNQSLTYTKYENKLYKVRAGIIWWKFVSLFMYVLGNDGNCFSSE